MTQENFIPQLVSLAKQLLSQLHNVEPHRLTFDLNDDGGCFASFDGLGIQLRIDGQTGEIEVLDETQDLPEWRPYT